MFRMCMIGTLAGLAVFGMPGRASASLMFDFSWSSAGSTPTPAGAVGSATGTFTIDKAASEAFVISDVTAFSITAMSTNISSFSISAFGAPNFFTGTIAGDGLSASLTDIFIGDVTEGFGCTSANCAGAGRVGVGSGGADDFFDFGNGLAAQQSFVLTASSMGSVPEPSTLLLFSAGLTGLALRRYRKRPSPEA